MATDTHTAPSVYPDDAWRERLARARELAMQEQVLANDLAEGRRSARPGAEAAMIGLFMLGGEDHAEN